MKRVFLSALLLVFSVQTAVSQQKTYKHGVFWGRLVLADKITDNLRWELYVQKRTQTEEAHSANIFAAPHFFSIWPWLNYKLSESTKLSLSPVAYFDAHQFYNSPSEVKEDGVKEFRISARIENERKSRLFNYANRYSMEYRMRDLDYNGTYEPNWRARYQVRLEKPFMNVFSKQKPLSVYVGDEIFIQFGEAVRNNPNIFDQNRINIGVAYEIFKNVKLNASYLNIMQARISGKELDDADALWIIVTFDNLFTQFTKKK